MIALQGLSPDQGLVPPRLSGSVKSSYNRQIVRRILVSVLLASSIGASALTVHSHPDQQTTTGEGQTTAAFYVCPMHPDVMSAIPGKCPRCSMELVAAPASAYVCPMHPDVMSASPGKCPRCGMELVAGSPITMPDFRLRVETTRKRAQSGDADQVSLHGASSADRRAGARVCDRARQAVSPVRHQS